MDDTNFSGLSGKIITPLSPEYNKARQQFNRAMQKYPAVIVYCYNKFDVINAVKWSHANGFAIRIRNGGHNGEGFSTGNGIVVIDISNMKALSVDNNLLKIECGVKLDRLYDYLSALGYPFPGGSCPTAGVCGSVLGGGWGLSCRRLGLGCDSLAELEIIDYNGEIVTANSEVNADLFWACRGAGGGNFGVIVSMTFLLSSKIEKITLITFDYPVTNKQMQTEFFDIWQNWLADADERITLSSEIYRLGETAAIRGKGLLYGTAEEAEKIMQPFANLKGLLLNIAQMPYIEAVRKITDEYPNSEMFKSFGRFVTDPLNASEILQLVELLDTVPESCSYAGLNLYALGGKAAEKNSSDTAFFYRNAKYVLELKSVWRHQLGARAGIQWIDNHFKYVESVTQGSYVNLPYGKLENYLESYYGANAERLRIIKKKYDPNNIFGFPQSIHQIV